MSVQDQAKIIAALSARVAALERAASVRPGELPTSLPVPITEGGTDATTAADARANLGLGDLAVQSSVSDDDWSGTDLAIVNGGTGSSTASGARSNLGVRKTIEFCRPQQRAVDSTFTINANTWYSTTLGTSYGGVSMTGAVAVFVNFAIIANGGGSLSVRRYNGTVPSATAMNWNSSGVFSNGIWIEIDGSRRFHWRSNVSSASRYIVDLQAVAFS